MGRSNQERKKSAGSPATSRARLAADRLARLFHAGGGVVTWEEFIRAALYDPDFGYYTTAISAIGLRGDFTTAPAASRLLGAAIACRAGQFRDGLPRGARPGLIEAGAGEGHLMETILKRIGFFQRRGWRPMIVETSPVLEAIQRRRLGRRIRIWEREPEAALRHCDGCAFLFANELADAFPPVVAEWRGGRWHEVVLSLRDGGLAEVQREPGDRCAEALRVSSLARRAGTDGGQGHCLRIEILLGFKEWIERLASAAREVELLIIDYGGSAEELHQRAPRGTLRAYYKHQVFNGIEAARRFGLQDITCDVNFTDIVNWADGAGFRPGECVELSEFLVRHLSGREAAAADPAGRRLLNPDDAGGRFHALSLIKR